MALKNLGESGLNFGIALLKKSCDNNYHQSVNRAKNRNWGQNRKTDTVTFGIFEVVISGFLTIFSQQNVHQQVLGIWGDFEVKDIIAGWGPK